MKTRLLLGTLILGTLIALLTYISQTRQYPQWDEHHYLNIAVLTLDAIREKGMIGIADSIQIGGSRQPLYGVLIASLLVFFGTVHTYELALTINVVLFCLSIIGTYLLAREFIRQTPSLFAAFLFATFGNTLFYAHFTYVETATTTAIIYSLLLLKKTRGFSERKFSIWAGLATALATLTRFVAPVFMFGPILVTILEAILHKDSRKRMYSLERITHIVLFLCMAIVIPLLLYFIPNREAFMTYVTNNQSQGAEWVKTYRDPAMANTFSLRSILFYMNIFQQNTIGMFIIFAAGMLIALRYVRRYAFLIASFLSPYAFFALIAVWKEDRFIVPIYPVIAIISALVFEHLSPLAIGKNRSLSHIQTIRRNLSIIVGTVILGLGIFNAIGGLFAIGPMGARGLVDYVTPRWVPHPRRLYLTPLVWPPTKEYSNAHLFVEAIEKDWNQPRNARILLTFTHEPFFNAVYGLLLYEKRHLATLTVQEGSTQADEFDYVATQMELPNQEYLTKIFIPYDSSTVYLYKNQ